jgi:hypothetical protein
MRRFAVKRKFEIVRGGAGQAGFALTIFRHSEGCKQPGDTEENDHCEDIPLHAF